jgi:molybdate transport system permease protein
MAESISTHIRPLAPAITTRKRRPPNPLPWLSVPLLGFLLLPLIALLLRVSPEQLISHLGQSMVVQAITLSFSTTLIATALTIVLGTPLAYLLARRRFRWQRVIDTLIDLPTVLPPAVAGLALLMAFGRQGLVGSLLNDLGLQIAFSQTAVILAQLFVAAPFYIRSARVGFASVSFDLEQAAALDGAHGGQIFRLVTLPLAWSNLVSGAVMTWARALGEFGATMIFAGNFPGRTQTMPLAIYLGFEMDLDIALTLSVILIACSFAVLMIVKSLLNREAVAVEGGVY